MRSGGSAHLIPLHAQRGDGRERHQAAEAWLYKAAQVPETAAQDWSTHGVALLTAGVAWDAVRVQFPASDSTLQRDTDPDAMRRRLHELGLTGPVFCDPYRPYLYVLVPRGTDQQWPRTLTVAGVKCLGGTPPYIHHVAVPRLDKVSPPGPYWLAPPDGSGRFTDPQRLYEVLAARAVEAGQ